MYNKKVALYIHSFIYLSTSRSVCVCVWLSDKIGQIEVVDDDEVAGYVEIVHPQ